MAELARPEARYAAFLSYSHRDAAAAGQLHRRLETYRLPKRLAGSEGARGTVPQRLWPIFRDREELPAATDLSETVREALARSGALIVLCSPHAVASLWVAEEIKVFRELHPDRPILAAVLDGDPPDCFPSALRAVGKDGAWHEPLATDLRRGRDGAQLGLLKLVAGITGVGLDALVQRDAARKIRRVTAVTAVAVIAMLIMGVLAVIAINARREADRQRIAAERQRIEAEGLVEFMLTDLRDRLRGVGNLDVMESVNARALRYYRGRGDLADLPDESLALRARIFQAIGDDYISRHRLDSALGAFREARLVTMELLSRAPNDPRRISEHAKSDFGIGRVHEIRRDWSVAQHYYSAFAAAADRLVSIVPNNPDYMMKAASSSVDLGNIQLNGTQDYAAAERSYQRAVRWFERAAQARPADLHVLFAQANAYGWLADSFFARNQWRPSLDARLRQYAIVESLHRTHPANREVSFRLAAARRGLAYSFIRMGDRDRARAHLFQAYESIERLTRRDPENAEWRLLKSLLSYDLLHVGLGLPPGVAAARLQRDQIRRDSHRGERPANSSRLRTAH